ncbi:MAG TPA: TonB family protein [Thermoanaerobaculia bacterium]|nr:TonB family protein [Thermoanaerobaculia bacterium]
MEDKKPCVRCDRAIDPYARICPYCNWDQSSAAPPPSDPQPAAAGGYTPPSERNWRRHLLMVGGLILLLVGSFVIGSIINRDDAAPEDAPKPVSEAEDDAGIPRTRRADVTLVPFNDAASLEQPITSAPVPNPAQGIPTEYQRRDATAVSSVEYAALAQRAQAEREAQRQMVDPRSLTGPAYAQAPRRPAPQAPPEQQEPVPPPMTSASPDPAAEREPEPSGEVTRREPARVVERTRPVPQHQPVPRISVSQPVTARLELTVGADGRVKQVRIKNSIPGHTPELIAAVQSWRFKPATENGVPVAAPFSVDISFNP